MSEDPVFYASLITDGFKPENQEVPELAGSQQAKAKAAYRLLTEFYVVPGAHDGTVEADVLFS